MVLDALPAHNLQSGSYDLYSYTPPKLLHPQASSTMPKRKSCRPMRTLASFDNKAENHEAPDGRTKTSRIPPLVLQYQGPYTVVMLEELHGVHFSPKFPGAGWNGLFPQGWHGRCHCPRGTTQLRSYHTNQDREFPPPRSHRSAIRILTDGTSEPR